MNQIKPDTRRTSETTSLIDVISEALLNARISQNELERNLEMVMVAHSLNCTEKEKNSEATLESCPLSIQLWEIKKQIDHFTLRNEDINSRLRV